MTIASWSRTPECVLTPLQDGTSALFDMRSGEFIVLNETCAALWSHLGAPTSIETLAEKLRVEFQNTPPDLEAAIKQMLDELREQGLVTVHMA